MVDTLFKVIILHIRILIKGNDAYNMIIAHSIKVCYAHHFSLLPLRSKSEFWRLFFFIFLQKMAIMHIKINEIKYTTTYKQ